MAIKKLQIETLLKLLMIVYSIIVFYYGCIFLPLVVNGKQQEVVLPNSNVQRSSKYRGGIAAFVWLRL